jgi:hypothetical protein
MLSGRCVVSQPRRVLLPPFLDPVVR